MSDQPEKKIELSALLVVHNEETRLAACLERLGFCDEIVVVLDRCTDGTPALAESFGCRCIEGAWPIEGDRRNTGNDACNGDWILEVDADEWLSPELGEEIKRAIAAPDADYYLLPFDNYIGDRCVRYGWGAHFGKSSAAGLCRKGVKHYGRQRVHPSLHWQEGAVKGRRLSHPVTHFVDRDISDMIRRFDSYTSARARDLVEQDGIGSSLANFRRILSRFFRCFVSRKGYKEGGYGFLIATFAALYPMVSHLKAKYETKAIRQELATENKPEDSS